MGKRRDRKPHSINWADILDVDAAVKSARAERYGDWLRDPWEWPELDHISKQPELLFSRLRSGRIRFEPVDVPKSNYGTRPAVVQDPTDRIIYHALVGAVSQQISTGLSKNVCGWRLSRKNPVTGRYRNNRQEWDLFRKKRRQFAEGKDTLLVTDVTNYFASIETGRLGSIVESKIGQNATTKTLTECLDTYNRIPSRAGIPQRSTASSLLANVYMASVDDLLVRYCKSDSGRHWLRWMDDIWVFGGDFEELRDCQLDMQNELRSIGLEINLGKTRYFEGDEVLRNIARQELGRADAPVVFAASGIQFEYEVDFEELGHLVAEMGDNPDRTDRTVYSYVCNRLGRNRICAWMDELTEIARRAPHAADHFSRLFARNGHWRELDVWWTDFASSDIGRNHLPWTVAQLGTMFPSVDGNDIVADFLCTQLERSATMPLEMAALAAHRLPFGRPDDAPALLREFSSQTPSPMCRRLGAIALYNSGEDMQRIRSILGEFEENRATLSMLEARRGKSIVAAYDFDIASHPEWRE